MKDVTVMCRFQDLWPDVLQVWQWALHPRSLAVRLLWWLQGWQWRTQLQWVMTVRLFSCSFDGICSTEVQASGLGCGWGGSGYFGLGWFSWFFLLVFLITRTVWSVLLLVFLIIRTVWFVLHVFLITTTIWFLLLVFLVTRRSGLLFFLFFWSEGQSDLCLFFWSQGQLHLFFLFFWSQGQPDLLGELSCLL